MGLYEYRSDFFNYQQIGALTSARAVAPLLLRHLKSRSVLDVGCGAGAWVRAYLEAGLGDVVGVDGSYVQPSQLMFSPARFRPIDVARPFQLGRRFDLAQCLEVAEHLDPQASETIVDNLTAHASMVLFSAAPPGQGGEHHINERPYEFWQELFERRGYRVFDFVREHILYRPDVEPWYRYNVMLFVHDDAIASLPACVRDTRVQGHAFADVAPLAWRARRRLLAMLPPGAVTALAMAKHRAVLSRRAGTQA
jgi:SAM-dependent methyltransferase